MILNRSGEIRHPCLVPSTNEKSFSLSPLSVMLIVGVSVNALFRLTKFPSIPSLLRIVVMNR